MALTIVVRQLGKLVGVSTGDGNFFARLWHVLDHAPDWSLATIAVGALAVAALLLLERFVPRLPSSLIVLVVGIVVSAAAHLDRHGVEIVGKIPRAVPTPAWPDLAWDQWTALAGGAFGLALVVFAESHSISTNLARDHGGKVDASREMIGMGAANAAVGLFRGFAVSGSASRSAAAFASGGSSQMVSVVAAAMVLVTGAFLTTAFTDLPEAVLGAIVVAVRSFLKVGELRRYWRLDRPSLWSAATALIGVLVFDLLPGLLIAVTLSLVLFIAAAGTPDLAVLGKVPGTDLYADTAGRPDVRTVAGLLVVRPDGALFFGNVARLQQAVLDQVDSRTEPTRVVVLDLSASFRLGLPVLDTLDELRQELDRRGIRLWLTRLRSHTRDDIAAVPPGPAVGRGPDHRPRPHRRTPPPPPQPAQRRPHPPRHEGERARGHPCGSDPDTDQATTPRPARGQGSGRHHRGRRPGTAAPPVRRTRRAGQVVRDRHPLTVATSGDPLAGSLRAAPHRRMRYGARPEEATRHGVDARHGAAARIAISPVPVIATILTLFAPQARPPGRVSCSATCWARSPPARWCCGSRTPPAPGPRQAVHRSQPRSSSIWGWCSCSWR